MQMLKFILAWIPMVIIAIANAFLRESVLAKHLDELRAHQASTVTCVLFFGIYIWTLIHLLRPESPRQALTIGALWLVLTVAFEFLFGHYAVGHPLSRLLHDYNILAGRVWIFVLVWITLAPYLFYRLQNHD
jgi:hypothetical protein